MIKYTMLLLLLAGLCFSNTIARDATPGGLYFIGPDVSPDSTDLQFLYYSPDTGKTLYIRDTIPDWWFSRSIAADATSGIIYVSCDDGGTYLTKTSYDYGTSWDHEFAFNGTLISGLIPGELAINAGLWSVDDGVSFHWGDGIGWPGSGYEYTYCMGHMAGMSLISRSDDYLYYTMDYGDHFDTLRYIESGEIQKGADQYEYYILGGLLNREYVVYSFNACTTFTYNSLTVPMSSYTTIFCRGWQTREIIACCPTRYMNDTTYEYTGGEISIYISSDCGATWRQVTNHTSSAITDDRSEMLDNEYLIEQQENNISSPKELRVYNMSGRLITMGYNIDLRNQNTGLYIATNGKAKKKIVIIK